jgi:hypothetical protein
VADSSALGITCKQFDAFMIPVIYIRLCFVKIADCLINKAKQSFRGKTLYAFELLGFELFFVKSRNAVLVQFTGSRPLS